MIEQIATAPRLLVATDFDGTLAEIVDDPDAAVPLPGIREVLEELAELDSTTVAVISGRRRSDLSARFDERRLILVGEHGSDRGEPMPEDSEALRRARHLANSVAADTPGSRVEQKRRSVGFHYRQVANPKAALENLRAGAREIDGLSVLEGKMIIEMSDAVTSKGSAVEVLRRETDADSVMFLGDDTTDETVFTSLRADDLGIHVGNGPTRAAVTVPDPTAVVAVLERLLETRRAFLRVSRDHT
jgi:trehalose 6-phosphate phosphatase